jgi:hypothetical protein
MSPPRDPLTPRFHWPQWERILVLAITSLYIQGWALPTGFR